MLISMRVGSEDDDNIFHLLSHQQLQLPPSFLSYLNARLAVIDTGKARLAKGILEGTLVCVGQQQTQIATLLVSH